MNYVEAKDGTKIAYDLKGAGQLVLLLGGLFEPIDSFSELRPKLHQHGYSTLKIGYRGLGLTHTFDRFRLEDIVEDVITVIETIQLKRFYILSEALGGTIALKLAHDYPHMVKKLFLACTASMRDARFRLKMKSWNQILAKVDLETLFDVAIADMASQEFLEHNYDHLDTFKEQVLEAKKTHEVHWLFEATKQYKHNLDYTRVRQPVMLIHGTEDAILHPGHSRFLAHTLPNADLVELECGHMLSEEKPFEFSQLATEFFDKK